MPKAFLLEFRRDVVAVARKGEAPIGQIAKDFGISQSCLQRWLKLADIEDGNSRGVTQAESVELRDSKKRIRQLEQEVEILRRAAAYFARDIKGKSRPVHLRGGDHGLGVAGAGRHRHGCCRRGVGSRQHR